MSAGLRQSAHRSAASAPPVEPVEETRAVARGLLQAVTAMAEASGARSIYVSATSSESAVGFYLSQGFRLTADPDPEMYKLGPEDIHMVRPLLSAN